MWEWLYTGMTLKDGTTVFQITTADRRVPGQEKEWLKAQVEVETQPSLSEPATRLAALQKLRTLIDGEIESLERRHGGAER